MIERTYSPVFEPSLDAFKSHLRVTSSDFDLDLIAKLKASIVSAEHFIGKTIAKSTFVIKRSFANTVYLRTPLISVVSVKVDGTVLQSSRWSVDSPSGQLTVNNAIEGVDIEIAYIAGMNYVPEDIKAAIFLHGAYLFENPVDSVESLPKASSNLLRPYKTWTKKHSDLE